MQAGEEAVAGECRGLCDTQRAASQPGARTGTLLGLLPENGSAPGRHEAEGLQDEAAKPFGSSDPLFDFFSVPILAAPVLGAAQSPASGPSGVSA